MGLLDEAIREHLQLKRRRGADPTEVERLEREALGPVRRGPRDPAGLAMDDPAEAAMDDPVGLAVDDPAGLAVDDARAESAATYSDVEMEREWVEPGVGEGLFDYQAEDSERVSEVEEPGRGYEAGELGPAYEAGEPEREAPRHREIAEEWDSHEPLDFNESPEPAAARDALDDEPLTDEHPAAAGPPPSGDATPPRDAPPRNGAPPLAPPHSHDAHLGEATVEYDVEAEHLHEREGEDVLEETPEFLQDTPDHDRLWFEQKPPRDFDLDG